MTLNTLNDEANRKFNELRYKLKLDVQKTFIQEGIELTQKKINEANDPDEPSQILQHHVDEAVSAAEIVDNTFDFIQKLELPSRLSLAIGFIISANKKKNWEELNMARNMIKEHLYFVGFGGIENEKEVEYAKRKEETNS